jgi:hypothetical protein
MANVAGSAAVIVLACIMAAVIASGCIGQNQQGVGYGGNLSQDHQFPPGRGGPSGGRTADPAIFAGLIQACGGKSLNDTCTAVAGNRTINGTCQPMNQTKGSSLACRPEGMFGQRQFGNQTGQQPWGYGKRLANGNQSQQ